MEEILKWLSTYSLPIVFLIILGAVFIYLVKMVTEKAITNEFDRHKKVIELELERRSSFEEKILLDRYSIIRELQTKIGNIMTNINRIRHGVKIDGFIVNNDIVPLTEVFELLAVNKYLITKKFHDIFWQQSQIALSLANEKDGLHLKQLEAKYIELLENFYKEMNEMFDLEKIKWKA